MHRSLILLGLIAVFLLLTRRWERRKLRHPPKSADPLSVPLIWWTPHDPLTIRQLLNGGVAIFGRTGSGKTSSSGRALVQAVIRSKVKTGGLIIAAKPEDRAMFEAWFAAAGRAAELLVFAPDKPLRFNFIGYVLASGGSVRDVTKCITVIGETLRNADAKGGENADFWEKMQEKTIYHAVQAVWLAHGTVTAPDLQKFILSAPLSAAQIATEEWQKGYCNQTLALSFSKAKTPIEAHDYQLAIDYWLNEYPNMADKTRSSITTGVLGILHTFNVGLTRELVSSETNVSPDNMLAGKWVLVDMPQSEYGDNGALVAAGWKYLTQKRVLRRAAKPGDPPVVIWADEAQTVVNSFDAHYLAQCRSHLGCMVYLTQSLHSYLEQMKGERGHHAAKALLANFAAAKVFHALGDSETSQWAQALIGRRVTTFVGTSMPPPENLFDEVMGHHKVTTSTSEHMDHILETNVFMSGLRTGGHQNGLICDAIVVRSGEPFSNGSSWVWSEFSQE